MFDPYNTICMRKCGLSSLVLSDLKWTGNSYAGKHSKTESVNMVDDRKLADNNSFDESVEG